MAEAGPGAAGGYVAFISYSHKDAAIGRWLHRKLEGYRLPGRLAGTEGEDGLVPTRLTPIFRDRDELPAAGDLSEKVRAALAVSRNLIVVCSPHSAASRWVAREIVTFRELHPDRPIFSAIIEGEPDQCFPTALREGGSEPLAADLRREGDGRRLGLLKLVAGLAGVGLDQLVQRDAARRIRRVTYVTAAAVMAMLVMAFLTLFALNSRAEAQRQRTQAEGLVEFMLTDLRRELKGAAGLRVLTLANDRALKYYRTQDLDGLPAESLERRARILHAMAEDDLSAAKIDRAAQRLEEAAATTSRLLADDPDDQQRLFTHAQSEFWIGATALRRHEFTRARQAFLEYKELAERLVAAARFNPQWRAELAYAEGNLCTVELDSGGDLDAAAKSCTVSLVEMQRAADAGHDLDWEVAVPNRYGWLADVERKRGNGPRARALRERQEALLTDMLTRLAGNLDLTESWLTNQTGLAELEIDRCELAAAGNRLRAARTRADALVAADPDNQTWKTRREVIVADLRKIDDIRRVPSCHRSSRSERVQRDDSDVKNPSV
jgi:hypothetical protein